jgi:SAM-dependent methyltransferase
MNGNHWQDYHRAWSRLTPPLRPPPAAVAAVKAQVGGGRGRALLLGVTPELAGIAPRLVAVDRNPAMIAALWPGDSASRHALVGDWRRLSFARAAFALCIGDGSLSSLEHPGDVAAAARELARTVESGGRIVCRLYLSPQRAESVAALRDAAMAGRAGNFHGFKMRLAMALAAREKQPNIRVAAIRDAFDTLFADRDGLVRATGWRRDQVDTIDFYEGSAVSYSFPTQDQLLAAVAPAFSAVRLVPSGAYDLAERCPLLVAAVP